MKCVLCHKGILPGEKMIRVLVEEVSRDEDEDGADAEYWTIVEDWEVLSGMHSQCARDALRQSKEVPYQDEIRKLAFGRYLTSLSLVEAS